MRTCFAQQHKQTFLRFGNFRHVREAGVQNCAGPKRFASVQLARTRLAGSQLPELPFLRPLFLLFQVEKQLTQQRLNQLDAEDQQGFVRGLLSKAVRSAVVREQQRLVEAEDVFKALDLNKVHPFFSWRAFHQFQSSWEGGHAAEFFSLHHKIP